ncbi:MAG TPA: tail fiber domain-containing protein [Candidatus Acidoferrum sp.]|nr:tail fiber domain-containing protein [Candidatus Acidoferrum sp.]
MKTTCIAGSLFSIAFSAGLCAFAQGTAFTYQGQLTESGAPAGGAYDLVFELFDAWTGGNSLGGPLTNNSVAATGGLFTVTLDFGASPFSAGGPRWLEIQVRHAGTGAFALLSPRQPVTAAPYAIVAGTVTGPIAGAFYGNGGGLTNVNASTLGGVAPGNFWQTGGNFGANGNWYVGTADYQPLQLRVNQTPALRLLPTLEGWPNSILGASNNLISADVTAAGIGGGVNNTISDVCGSAGIGGGRNNLLQLHAAGGFIGGGQWNVLGDGSVRSVISGGYSNTIRGFTSTNAASIARDITDGTSNTILVGETPPGSATIGGGYLNSIGQDATGAFIGGGEQNVIGDGSVRSVTSGGSLHQIGLAVHNATIAGGWSNSIGDSADYAAVGGGAVNSIGSNCVGAVLCGGQTNFISGDASGGFIGGGSLNHIEDGTDNTIIAGENNTIGTGSGFSTVGGGRWNTNTALYATIPGGALNYASGAYSFASGRRAKSFHDGTFVWADSLDADFPSVTPNEFCARADGGVRFITGGAGMSLDGQPVISGYNAALLTNLNATALTAGTVPDARLAPNVARTNQVWLLGGNVATLPGTQFIGTADNQPLEFKVSGNRALRLEPNTNGAPGIIAGSIMNGISSGTAGATIGGGGATNYNGIAYINSVAGDFGTIGGGRANAVRSASADATIGGGVLNAVNSSAPAASIGGGSNNVIQTGAALGAIAGGAFNTISNNAFACVIAGGTSNLIQAGAALATIAGGASNTVSINAFASVIGGGSNNVIQSSANRSVIAGGTGNTIELGSAWSTIGGGQQNTIGSVGATIPGGQLNRALGFDSFAAGYRAKADFNGTFVWADDAIAADFVATGPDQFLIRASGGVGVNTTSPVADLHVNGATVFQRGLTPTAATASNIINIAVGVNTNAFQNGISFYEGAGNTSMSFGYDGSGAGSDNALRIYNSAGSNVFTFEHGGFLGLGVVNPSNPIQHFSGALLTSSGVWQNASDKNRKTDFQPVNAEAVLAKVAALPVRSWRYTNELETVRHVGPTAQDFQAAFGLGTDDKSIGTVDEEGVALAAIQGLNRKLQDELSRVRAENAALQSRLEHLEALVSARLNQEK